MDADDTALELLAARALGATICPSEVARALAAAAGAETADRDWRKMMPAVHSAVDRLVADGKIRLSWKGEMLSSRTGPYRIRREGPDLPNQSK